MSLARKNPVSWLRKVSLAEGVSYLLLLGIAMPLKYWAGMALAVKIVGSAHGALFVALCGSLLWTLLAARWPLGRAVLVFLASLVPLVPFWMDRHMRAWESSFANKDR